MTRLIWVAVLASFATASLLAAPSVTGITNAASYALEGLPNAGIAQGSMFVVFGDDIGPVNLAIVSAFPLPITIGGASAKVTVGGATVDCIGIYASKTQSAFVLPSNTPVGNGTLQVTFNGQQSNAKAIRVVKSSPGLFTRNQAGSGPAIVQNFISQTNQPVNALIESLNPGQVGTLWLTGLGPVAGNEAGGPLPGNLPVNVELWIGNQRATVTYAGRSGCCVGIDQVVFQTPANVSGCYVPLYLKVDGVVSNFGSVSIANTGKFCPDNFLTQAELQKVAAGGNFSLGSLGVSKVNIKAQIAGQAIDLTTESAVGVFERFAAASFLAAQPDSAGLPVGSCVVYQYREDKTPGEDPVQGTGLDAGPQLNLNGPKGAKTIDKQPLATGVYFSMLSQTGIPGVPGGGSPYLDPGAYTISGPGGTQVGPFNVGLNLPQLLNWTNADSFTNIPRAQPLTVTWTGGNAAQEYAVIVGGSTAPSLKAGAAFVCLANVGAGRFTVPADIVSQLPASAVVEGTPTGTLAVGSTSTGVRFNATGLDLGVAAYSTQTQRYVNYQ